MTNTIPRKTAAWSAGICNASLLLYVLWLMLPAVQTTGRALSGVAAVGLFAVGVLLDADTWKRNLLGLLLRAVCIAAMPFLAFYLMGRGGDNLPAFIVQHGMFWFPLVYTGYARHRGDARLWRGLKCVLLAAVTITLLTTIFWLVEGMFFRGDQVYAYARSLGNAEPGNEAYLKELMLKNIGGYDFVYAMVAALPLSMLGIRRNRGWKRMAYIVLVCLQTIMVLLSQYTYAMLYTAVILAMEIVAALVRAISRGKLGEGASLLLGLVPLVLLWLFRLPLLQLAAHLFAQAGLENFAFSLEQLTIALQGGVTDSNSRLVHYQTAWAGVTRSPLLGSLLGGEQLLSRHSDVLDVLSGVGLLGGLAVCVMIWLMGRGSLKGLRHSADRAQLWVVWLAVLVTATFGTVCYSREIMAVAALGSLLVLEGNTDRPDQPATAGTAISGDEPDESI